MILPRLRQMNLLLSVHFNANYKSVIQNKDIDMFVEVSMVKIACYLTGLCEICDYLEFYIFPLGIKFIRYHL